MSKAKKQISTGKNYGASVIRNSANIDQPLKEVNTSLSVTVGKFDYWRFGSDNLFPNQIALLNRTASTHGGIIERKKDYCAGKGFNLDSIKDKFLQTWIASPNNTNENIQDICKKFFKSHFSLGNIFIEIVTNKRRQFVNLFIKDYTTCRLGRGKDEGSVIIYPDWECISNNVDTKKISIFPEFTEIDGNLHSIFVVKNIMEGFPIYGLPSFIPSLDPAETLKGANTHNRNRVKKGFSKDTIISAEFDNEEQANAVHKSIKDQIGDENAGDFILLKKGAGTNPVDFLTVPRNSEGEFLALRTASIEDLIVSHNWFRSLCGLADNTGFDTKRILNEYDVARATIIEPMQELFINTLTQIFGTLLSIDITGQLSFRNMPPVVDNTYMKLWEYRKHCGLDFNETDPMQMKYIFELNSKSSTNASN